MEKNMLTKHAFLRIARPLIALFVLTACELGSAAQTAVSSATATPNPTATVDYAPIEGMFDIGGINLYLKCEGTGSPTIVYLHGNIENEDFSGASSGDYIGPKLRDQYRFCVYDRRNVGKSDEIPGTYTGLEAVADLHALLASAGIEPPYVLLGASFGGLLADLYAKTYPGEVVGMVMLDAMFPFDMDLLPEDMRFKAEDDCCNNERLIHLTVVQAAYDAPQPAVPVIYLLAMPFTWDLGVAEYDAVVRDMIEAYVAGFSPGTLIEVQSPHYMEQAIPQKIADILVELITGLK